MRNKFPVLLITALTLAFIQPLALAAVKPGTACKTLGQTSTSSGIKYTCVKSGKKLIWNKGVAVKKVTPTPTPSATPTPTPSATPTPTPTAQPIVYSVQWSQCDEPFLGHDGWVLGRNANKTEFTFLRCTTSKNQDGSPTLVWQIPEDAAKIDQTTKFPISGAGFTPKTFSTTVIRPDWYYYTAENHPKGPTSFLDLYQNRSGIKYAAWSAIISAAKKSKANFPVFEIASSNPKVSYSSLGLANLEFLHRAMNVPAGVKKVKIYYFDRTTLAQVAALVEAEMGSAEYNRALQNQGGPLVQCYGTTDCNNSNAWAASDGTLYMTMGVANTPDSRTLLGGSEPSEYFHAVWTYIYAKNNALKAGPSPAVFPSNQPPFWLNIGLEEISTNSSITVSDFRKYMSFSLNNATGLYSAIPEFNQAWLNSYLDLSNLGNRWSDAHQGLPNDSASIFGPRLGEILIAIRGTDAFFDFYLRMSQGEAFDEVFKDIYKISWQEAQPILVKVIYEDLTG